VDKRGVTLKLRGDKRRVTLKLRGDEKGVTLKPMGEYRGLFTRKGPSVIKIHSFPPQNTFFTVFKSPHILIL
jgi:hypothetical protein